MEPIIYTLPKTDKNIQLVESNIYFDDEPSPKLIKYGFNNVIEQLDLITLTSNAHYKAGLSFDFSRTDKDSIMVRGEKFFPKIFDQTFAEFWEILNLFGLLNRNQDTLTNRPDTLKNISAIYQKLRKEKSSLNILTTKSKEKSTLVIYKYSDTDIDENALVQLLINDIEKMTLSQSTGANMIIQIFSLQTQIMTELVYFLSAQYTEAYLMRPTVTSDLSDSRYVVLLNLKAPIKISVPKHPANVYLAKIHILVPDDFVLVVQCMNSDVIPNKFGTYYKIKSYLDTKIYEGATYTEMMEKQYTNMEKWLETFVGSDNIRAVLDTALERTKKRCDHHAEWDNLFV
jgi:hypothetical protein